MKPRKPYLLTFDPDYFKTALFKRLQFPLQKRDINKTNLKT